MENEHVLVYEQEMLTWGKKVQIRWAGNQSIKGMWKSPFFLFPYLVWELVESANTIRMVVKEQRGTEQREAKKLNDPAVMDRIFKAWAGGEDC